MAISASMVKELRQRTGAGMMECKNALVENDGNLEAAADYMRKKGMAKADKKAGRVAAEGLIGVATSGGTGVLVEVNSETDFVTKSDDFKAFVDAVTRTALENPVESAEQLLEQTLDGDSVEVARKSLIAKIGENITVRRVQRIEAAEGNRLGTYVHGTAIAVMVEVNGGDDDIVRDVAMHIAASNPTCVSADQVPAEMVAKEREILVAQAADSGKPPEIIEKMVDGRMRKYFAEITLMGQPFVKDPDQTVEKMLKGAGATVARFVRMVVGEGVEKKTENFADEVMAQVRGD